MAKRLQKSALNTLRLLAEHLGQEPNTVGTWVRHPAWTWPRKAPWNPNDKPAMLRWAADKREAAGKPREISKAGRPQKTDPDSERSLRHQKLEQEVRKLRAQADQAETALARERGELLDAAEVEREWAAVGVVVRNSLENLASQIVPLALTAGMPHNASDEFRAKVDELVRGVLSHLSKVEDTAASVAAVLSEPVSA